MLLTEVLPKIPQYESIPYTRDFVCPHCDKSGFFDGYGEPRIKPNVIGWCDTNIGYMIVFECPCCFKKYRFHGTVGTWNADIDEFEYYFRFHASQCANWKEVELKLIEK